MNSAAREIKYTESEVFFIKTRNTVCSDREGKEFLKPRVTLFFLQQ